MNRSLRVGLLAVVAGIALAGCLPEAGTGAARAPANSPPNTAPVIAGTPSTAATAGTPWQFLPSASDADGDALTFSATGLPGWATVNPQSGLVSGTPSAGDVGTTGSIRVSVSDGEATASLATFAIVVAPASSTPPPPPPVNRAPIISGLPPTSGLVGSNYLFAPTASDPDGDALTWSITGKPADASFNLSNGRLTWTPATAGTWTGIVITVTDSRGAAASLPAFSITINPLAAAGSAALSWAAPVQFTDGSTLPAAQLTAYRVFHGSSAANLSRVAEVDAATTAFTVRDLGAGTHYFAVTAVLVSGTESAYSTVGSKTIQ